MKTKSRTAIAAAALASTLAVGHEGLKLVSYRDPPGIPTICVGRTKDVRMGDTATREQCLTWLGQEMMERVETVEACQPTVPWTPKMLAAYADITYNLGPSAACNRQTSTMARLLAAGQYEAACRQFPRWDKARMLGVLVPLPGLTRRRAENMQLCLDGLPS